MRARILKRHRPCDKSHSREMNGQDDTDHYSNGQHAMFDPFYVVEVLS
jgi:hypothetical protein